MLKLRRGSGAVGLRFPRNREDLLAEFTRPRRTSDVVFDHENLLVQEYAPGETHDACVLCRFGEPRAAYTQRRRWAFPVEGGVGTSVESTHEPALLDRAFRILKALEWHGPAQVEFRVDPNSGRTWLIEINGRFWGTLDGDIAPVFDYRVGRRYRFPIPFGFLALLSGDPRRQALREFFGPVPGIRSDLAWSDPVPLLAEVWYAGTRLWRRRRPGR